MCSVDTQLLKTPHMSVMRLATTMHNKAWESVVSPPQISAYKMERPAYSTPPPVENIPTNNECTMVELRGSKVASFTLGCDEYICLPQAFDLFLKHLVGGLHTVYTKLKRLNITPVVCNVEQVRILRGLGAIQPGVNRCKLITRKDFEILYQDCTTASRPGRPPKRYPVLPPTADLMSHHATLRSSNSLLNQTDLAAYHKRLRLGSMEQQIDRRSNGSPSKESEKSSPSLPVLPTDLHTSSTNPMTNYLQQALRQQYQQAAASSLHNGLDPQQISPSLAPFMMMTHPALFSSGIPPTSMAVLNHINQIAQSQVASGAMTSAAAAAAAHMAANGGKLSLPLRCSENAESSPHPDKDSDGEGAHTTPKSYGNTLGLSNGIGSDGRTSPASSLGSLHEGGVGHMSDGGMPAHHGFPVSFKEPNDSKSYVGGLSAAVKELTKASKIATSSDDELKPEENNNVSSMQTLLTNIQGLLKVAADNACLQEKHASIEIGELKLKLNDEKQRRAEVERKLLDCHKEKAEAEKLFIKQRNENKRLHDQIVSMQQMIGHDVSTSNNADEDEEPISSQPNSPLSNGVHACGAQSETSSTPPAVSSPVTSSAVTSSFDASALSARISASQQSGRKSNSCSPSPTSQTSIVSNINNNNSRSSDGTKSPDLSRRELMDSRADIAIDLGINRTEHSALQDQRLFLKNSPLLFQQATSQ